MRTQSVIVGCGGGGSWLAPALTLLQAPVDVLLVDGDKLEEKNLNRQLFTTADIGKNKAEALAAKYGCNAIPDWYNDGCMRHHPADWIFGCVDNNPARLSILRACDRYGCKAIFAANETTSAEAYVYVPHWKDSELDPRVYYPSMLTDTDGDPQQAAIGCTGESQQKTPQLVTANLMSAALAGHLYVAWQIELSQIDWDSRSELIPHLPYRLRANGTALETFPVSSVTPATV